MAEGAQTAAAPNCDDCAPNHLFSPDDFSRSQGFGRQHKQERIRGVCQPQRRSDGGPSATAGCGGGRRPRAQLCVYLLGAAGEALQEEGKGPSARLVTHGAE